MSRTRFRVNLHYHLLFELQLLVKYIFVFGTTQNSVSCGALCGPFWSAKYLNLGQKLLSGHTNISKNPYCVLSLKVRRKRLLPHIVNIWLTNIHSFFWQVNVITSLLSHLSKELGLKNSIKHIQLYAWHLSNIKDEYGLIRAF